MSNLFTERKARAPRINREHNERALLQARMINVGTGFIESLRTLPEDKLISLLTLQDEDFWAEIQSQAQLQNLISGKTPEKIEQEEYAEARLVFLKTLEKTGGVHKSTTAAALLSVSVPTLHKYGNNGKVIQIEWGAEKLYPVFQFSTAEKLKEKGMLRGVPELLSLITHNVSEIRKCNFFTRRIEMPLTGEKVSAIDVLRRGPSEQEMEHLRILAENFGTNHTM
jgi:hypothetical protein